MLILRLWEGGEGEKGSQQNASHAVGTTVRVSNFLQQLPVRKETAIKQAPRTLVRIRELLQAYAIARPAVRFSLKVLGSKSDKGSWIYAPRPNNATLADAALSVAGKDAAAQCFRYSSSSSVSYPSSLPHAKSTSGDGEAVEGGEGDEEAQGETEKGGFVIEAFLPKPKAGEFSLHPPLSIFGRVCGGIVFSFLAALTYSFCSQFCSSRSCQDQQ
jgi:hypothetical protein